MKSDNAENARRFWPTMDLSLPRARAALVIGHPGHELMVHRWLEETHPLVFVFTDGSGRSKHSRLFSTTNILNLAGARLGSIYGGLTDPEFYSAILNHKFDLFAGLARELAEALAAERIDYVAGDAFEGYNPTHDVARLVINAALTLAQHQTKSCVGNFEFSLITPPVVSHEPPHSGGICRVLDDASFARKMTAANGYTELAGEVQMAVERTSVTDLRRECLRPVSTSGVHAFDQPPYYETYGAQQVAAGHYQKVLRYEEHILPLANKLDRYVEDQTTQVDQIF